MELDELDELLIDADPAARARIPAAHSAVARFGFVQITGQQSPYRILQRRPVAVVAALVVVAALCVTVVLVALPGSPPSAAAVLQRSAVLAAAEPSVATGSYQYSETESLLAWTHYQRDGTSAMLSRAYTLLGEETLQTWTRGGVVARIVTTNGWIQITGSASVDDVVGSFLEVAPPIPLGATGWSLADVSGLPTDSKALGRVIARGSHHTNFEKISSGPDATFERAAALLVGPDVGLTPAVKGALFQVLAVQPGVRLVGTVTDHVGQQGQGVVLLRDPADVRQPLFGHVTGAVIDPTTGAVLEVRYAPPAGTIAPTMTCVGAPSSGTPSQCAPVTSQESIIPAWTDVLASGTVRAVGDTVRAARGAAPPALLPGAPTHLTAGTEGHQLHLDWSAPTHPGTSPITDYLYLEYAGDMAEMVWAKNKGTEGPAVNQTNSAATAATVPWILLGQSVTVRIEAVNASGVGPPSAPVTINP